MPHTVGQLAKMTGLTVRTLHHWDAIGLLTPSHRSEAGYRLYGRTDIARLFRVVALQRLGLPLADIGRALADGGAALPDLVSRQLDELDARIEQATALRARLARLRDMLDAGREPASEDWLAALELVTQYDRGFSNEELARMLEHRRSSGLAWPRLVSDIREAMALGIAPERPEAQELGRRWRTLMLEQAGGDLGLAVKVKLAYADQPALQARAQGQTGLDDAVITFVMNAVRHGHLAAWADHLDGAALSRLSLTDECMVEWVRLVAELRGLIDGGASPTSQALAPLVLTWHRLLDAATTGDGALRRRVEEVLHADTELQSVWALDAHVLAFMDAALASTATRTPRAIDGQGTEDPTHA